LAGLIYSIITMIILYPVSIRPNALLPVHAYDTYQHVWSLWWFRYAIINLNISPSQVTHLFAPEGIYMPLLMTSPIPHLFSIPLQPILGLIGTYNFLLIISFPLCGLAMYMLAFDLTGSHRGAFIAGLIYAFFTGKMVHLVGHYLQFHLYWLPLYILFLLRTLKRPTIPNALFCGIFLALSCLSHLIHTAFFVAPTTAIILIYTLITQWRSILTVRTLSHLALAFALGAAILAPFFLPYLTQYLTEPDAFLYTGGDESFCADLLHFFVPAPNHPLLRLFPNVRLWITRLIPAHGNTAESVMYLGWTAMALAFIGSRAHPRKTRMWWILAIVAAVLAMGPVLRIAGSPIVLRLGESESPIPLLYSMITKVPFFSIGRTPGRADTTVTFGLAILAAFGAQRLFEVNLHPKLRHVILPAVTVLIVFEHLAWWPVPAFPTPVSHFYQQMSGDVDDSLISFPMFYTNRKGVHPATNYDMVYQPVHEHKTAGNYTWRWSARLKGYAMSLDQLLMPERGIDIIRHERAGDTISVLRMLGHRYIVVHKPPTLYSPKDALAQAQAWGAKERLTRADRFRASRIFGSKLDLIYEDNYLWAYEVPNNAVAPDTTWVFLGNGWYDPWIAETETRRWMQSDAEILVDRVEPGWVTVAFEASSRENDDLTVMLNGQAMATIHLSASEFREVTLLPIYLQQGRNILTLHSTVAVEGEMQWTTLVRNLHIAPVDPSSTSQESARTYIRISPGDENESYLIIGFYENETLSDSQYRWTAGEAHAIVPWPGMSTSEPISIVLRLDIATWRPDDVPPPRIAVEVEGALVYEEVIASPYRKLIEIDVPAVHNQNLADLEIKISSDIWIPPVSDLRNLGVAFFGMEISVE
jgi:hypothetical protein